MINSKSTKAELLAYIEELHSKNAALVDTCETLNKKAFDIAMQKNDIEMELGMVKREVDHAYDLIKQMDSRSLLRRILNR